MILYTAHDQEGQLLKSILDVKNIEYQTETVASESAISDGDLLLDDIFAAIKYLDERHPKPQLFSNIPEQNARLNLFALKTLKIYGRKITEQQFKDLDRIIPETFLMGEDLTIADLILYQILPNNLKWAKYKQKIEKLINKKLDK